MDAKFITAIDGEGRVYISIPGYSLEDIDEALKIREANRIRGLADSLLDSPEE